MKEFVKKNDDKTGKNKLNNQEQTDTSAEITGRTIETSQDVDTGLTEGYDDGEKLLRSLV